VKSGLVNMFQSVFDWTNLMWEIIIMRLMKSL
jgi:hypothetical protein